MDSQQPLPVVSKCTVFPDRTSDLSPLKLSISDLSLLSCHYIQRGGLFLKPSFPLSEMLSLLKSSLSRTLTQFPPLAGRLTTNEDGYVYITCNDAGADFVHADGSHIYVSDLLGDGDVPEEVKLCFAFGWMVNYEGHFRPILAVQVTELADGVFIGCSVNHAVTDGTSFYNFFNSFAEFSRGANMISKMPDFTRDSVMISQVVLRLPEGGPKVTFAVDAPIRERIFSFSREAILKLKAKVNHQRPDQSSGGIDVAELMRKYSDDPLKNLNGKLTPFSTSEDTEKPPVEISSFKSLCALLWRGITRARKLPPSKTTTFQMAVNCRHRLEPKLNPLYFGNAVQTAVTYASAGDVLGKDLRWCAEQLNNTVTAHDGGMVKKYIGNWESNPRCLRLGNFDGGIIRMGGSPRFPMYDTDFGWGRPIAVRSGKAHKFDSRITACPGPEGGGSVDLEVILAPETMAVLESDPEFMQYVSGDHGWTAHC